MLGIIGSPSGCIGPSIAKVDEIDVIVDINEDVFQLDIVMNEVATVNIGETFYILQTAFSHAAPRMCHPDTNLSDFCVSPPTIVLMDHIITPDARG